VSVSAPKLTTAQQLMNEGLSTGALEQNKVRAVDSDSDETEDLTEDTEDAGNDNFFRDDHDAEAANTYAEDQLHELVEQRKRQKLSNPTAATTTPAPKPRPAGIIVKDEAYFLQKYPWMIGLL
jgi:hypothetical protein